MSNLLKLAGTVNDINAWHGRLGGWRSQGVYVCFLLKKGQPFGHHSIQRGLLHCQMSNDLPRHSRKKKWLLDTR
jgi:hypothetical protein